MIKRVCCIVNYNLYESKRHFTEKMVEAMHRHGIETHIIDVRENQFGALDIASLQKFNPDFTCSFNSILPMSNHQYFWDVIKIPHLSILVDPSLYSVALTNSPYSIISCVDRFDCEALHSSNFNNVFFWPHAVEKDLTIPEEQDRPLDVVFLGSCHDYENLRLSWQSLLPASVCQMLDHAIDLVLSDQFIPLAQALVTAWEAASLSNEGVDFNKLFYYLDYYTRGKDRVELIRSIKDAKVHVFGDLMIDESAYNKDWSYYLGNQSNVTLHRSMPFAQTFNILKHAKLCLNSMPFFKNGSHERIFTSLACGAVPVTSDSRYINEMFRSGEDLITYQPKQWQGVNEAINILLPDEKQRQDMALRGRNKVMRDHTWDKRVQQLIEVMPGILNRIV